MALFIRIAVRNLLRHTRRTALTLTSIAVGLAIVLWLQCITTGRSQRIIEMITSSYSGHLQIYRDAYLRDKLINDAFPPLPPNVLQAFPAGTDVTYRVHLPALISSGEQSAPILLEGIQPASEAKITTVEEKLVAGQFLEAEPAESCEKRQLYLGQSLAKLLNVSVGNKVVLLAQAADGTLANDLFRVSGIFESNSPGFDKSYVFSTSDCVQRLAAIQGFHEAVFLLPSDRLINDPVVREKLKAALPEGLSLTSWADIYPVMAGMVKFSDAILLMVTFMLFGVISLGIVNTLFMSVFERTREFGVMVALGTTPGQLRTIVLLESLILGIVSSLIGTALGIAVVAYHQRVGFDLQPFLGDRAGQSQFNVESVVYPIFDLVPFLKLLALTILIVVAAGFFPALRASRQRPVEAMSSH